MDNLAEKLKKFQIENNMLNHKFAKMLNTNSVYVKKWLSGQTVISRNIYKKLNKIGIE